MEQLQAAPQPQTSAPPPSMLALPEPAPGKASPQAQAVPAPVTQALVPLRRPPAMSGMRKASVLLITMGDVASGEIIKDLGEDEVQRIGRAVTMADPVTSEEALAVLEEFCQLATARRYVVKGGFEYASKMLRNAFGTDAARRLLDRVTQSINDEKANFDALQKAEPQQLANFVHNEHPQTIALILSHLNPSQSAAVLTALPAGMRVNVARRIANLEQISPDIIGRIAHVIGDKLQALGDVNRQSYGGVRALAEMFNRLDARLRHEVLSELAQDDGELVNTIRQLMFVFEDLLSVDPAGLRELVSAADRGVLAMALKGTSDALLNRLSENMSYTGAQMLREDIEALGPVRIKDVETAQQRIIALARELEGKGLLSLSGASNDQYVV